MTLVYRALTIAGSDSSGGAGIQADLKTFASLGVHGMTAVTAITAQNTKEVTLIQEIDAEVVKAQIDAVVTDIGVDSVKTGMLHSSRIIQVVADAVDRYGLKTVVDPVMISKSGARLLKQEAISTLIKELIPKATVITPNAPEATALSGIEVIDIESARCAAKKIADSGPIAVVVKGGHIPKNGMVVDVLYEEGRYYLFEDEEIHGNTTHGTGCTFASAIAAYLAKGEKIFNAVKKSQRLVHEAIIFGIPVGQGYGPVNPLARLYKEAEKRRVLENIVKAVDLLEACPEASNVIPEVNSNLAMASTYALDSDDVAGIPGRIVKIGGRVKALSYPTFGGSHHVANTILAAKRHNPTIKSAMNIKNSREILKKVKELGLTASSYDRREEPLELKNVEGMTTKWGAEEAIRKVGKVPNAIYHDGDWGKEAMITILGQDALEVVEIVLRLIKSMS